MDIEILKQKETPLLSRKRVSVMVTYEGATPSRVKLTKAIADKLKESPKLTVLRHIYTRFGKQNAKVICHIYKDEKTMITLEGEKLVAKHKGKDEPVAEEQKEDKAQETKAEEKSDEQTE